MNLLATRLERDPGLARQDRAAMRGRRKTPHRRPARRAWRALTAILLASSLSGTVLAQDFPDVTAISLEDLMNLKVTSVSKREEKLAVAPAAIFVITQEEIRRSGARNIPEALRLAPGLEVARIDENKWAIGSRGFARLCGPLRDLSADSGRIL